MAAAVLEDVSDVSGLLSKYMLFSTTQNEILPYFLGKSTQIKIKKVINIKI